ncbi:hypothetical protein BV22DRAFT_1104666 [Leucogyrophana mollusca]|uniref:Uncharacterized protein n=1 Tax=Leucogyrophana mollusca TaxID=85980 RepID=A0ACB8BK47_9AGAM|nr:hypothetical protein BV22DRAFT_1104666 [Leucogyrophana mollusca]
MADANTNEDDDADFPIMHSFRSKCEYIREWQCDMNANAQRRGVCAPCGQNVAELFLELDTILDPKGMMCTDALSDIKMCSDCHIALLSKHPRQPKHTLANFLYYGHEQRASPFNLMLVARCRSSRITHHYSHKCSVATRMPEDTSQRYNKGNVAILPQESVQLRELLPPGRDEIRSNAVPTREMLMKTKPVLVTKSIVKTLIEFLMENNSSYQSAGVRYSQAHMDDLFAEEDNDLDTSLLRAVEICHLAAADSQGQTEDSAGCDISACNVDSGELVMDNVGYTNGDHSPSSRESMKLHALAAALDHKPFLATRTGNQFLSDKEPDPWNIGSFHHPGRTRNQSMSFESHVKAVLKQDNSVFQADPSFAFICWNMIQKKEVSLNTTFRVKKSTQADVVKELKALANKWTTRQEKRAIKILWRLNTAIRALMRKLCTPALFVTLNPHDLTSSLLATVGGVDTGSWQNMTAFDRAKFVASNPGAAAIAFDLQIKVWGRGPGTVEAQGRGNPSPQSLRDKMRTDPDIISCHLPGQTEDMEKPKCEQHKSDPRLDTPPQVSDLDEESFAYEFRKFCNWHVHTDTCYKHLRNGEVHGRTRGLTEIDPETESIKLKRLHPRINSFIDIVIFLLQCNMDAKYIGSGEAVKALVYYIRLSALDYTIKQHANRFEGDTDSSEAVNNRNLMTKAEISHQQVIHTFRTLKLYEFLSALRYNERNRNQSMDGHIEVEPDDENARKEQMTLRIDKGNITVSSEIQDYCYRGTSTSFETLSLWEHTEWVVKDCMTEARTDIEDGNCNTEQFTDVDHGHDTSHCGRPCSKPVVPVVLGDAFLRPDRTKEEKERFCEVMLLLFKPWRTFEDLKCGYSSWRAAYDVREGLAKPLPYGSGADVSEEGEHGQYSQLEHSLCDDGDLDGCDDYSSDGESDDCDSFKCGTVAGIGRADGQAVNAAEAVGLFDV